jgi:HD-like signal output (HDOD) protein
MGALTSFEELVARTRTLPSLPGGIAKLLALDPSGPEFFDEACGIIKSDPGLTAQLLRLANSVQYKGQSSASSVERAFMRVGSRMVAVALAEGHVLRVFNSRDEAVIRLWAMCTLGGTLAQAIAERHPSVAVQPEAAYTFGLMHDIGYLVLLALFKAHAADLLTKHLIPSRASLEQEESVLGVTHIVAGGLVASQWGFPRDLQIVIASHHAVGARARGTSDVGLNRALDLLALVDEVVYLWVLTQYGGVAGRIDLAAVLASPGQQIFCRANGLTLEDLHQCLDRAIAAVEEKRQVVGLRKPLPFDDFDGGNVLRTKPRPWS